MGQLPLTGVGAAVTGYPFESAILGPAGGCSRVPHGPLPVGMVDLRALAPVLIQLHVALGAVGAPSITPVQRLRDAIALIFGHVSDDFMLQLQPYVDLCEAFVRACGRSAEVGKQGSCKQCCVKRQ